MAFEQLSLFIQGGETGQSSALPSLSELAFLYTATATGKNSGIHFMMSRDDAVTWCESDLSHGTYLGHPWAYFWTSIENFCNCHWGQLKNAELDLRKVRDNGKYDEIIESLGLVKYGKHEMKKILALYGIRVLV